MKLPYFSISRLLAVLIITCYTIMPMNTEDSFEAVPLGIDLIVRAILMRNHSPMLKYTQFKILSRDKQENDGFFIFNGDATECIIPAQLKQILRYCHLTLANDTAIISFAESTKAWFSQYYGNHNLHDIIISNLYHAAEFSQSIHTPYTPIERSRKKAPRIINYRTPPSPYVETLILAIYAMHHRDLTPQPNVMLAYDPHAMVIEPSEANKLSPSAYYLSAIEKQSASNPPLILLSPYLHNLLIQGRYQQFPNYYYYPPQTYTGSLDINVVCTLEILANKELHQEVDTLYQSTATIPTGIVYRCTGSHYQAALQQILSPGLDQLAQNSLLAYIHPAMKTLIQEEKQRRKNCYPVDFDILI